MYKQIMNEQIEHYNFTLLPYQSSFFTTHKDKIEQWDLKKSTTILKFSYDLYYDFNESKIDTFLNDFLVSYNVQNSFKILYSGKRDVWSQIGKVEQPIDYKVVESTITSMDFFDRLYTSGIVRQNGDIKRCFEETIDGVNIGDELKKMLLSEDSELFSLYNENERNQLLFLLFNHIVVGGGMSQYDDSITCYLDVAKDLYKEFIRPKAEIKVLRLQKDLFHKKDDKNLCILSIDQEKREVTLLYSAHLSFW